MNYFAIEIDEAVEYRDYVLRELAELKDEARSYPSHTFLEDHGDFMSEWKAKREARRII